MSATVKDIEKGIDQVFWAKMSRHRLAGWFIIISLMVTPAILSLLFIKEYGVNVPFQDQFDFIPLLDKFYAGNLTFADLFAQHNEHRILFPRLVMLALGHITHYNNVAEMYFSWFFLCLISYVIFRIYARSFGTSQTALAKFIPLVWLIFSLRQWQNLLWGFQIAWFMTVLFLLLSLYMLGTSKGIGWRFALAAVSGVVCSFSSGQGLLVWPVGLIQILWMWWSQRKESRWQYLKMTSVWCLMGLLVYIAYFIGYTHPGHHPSLLYFVHHPFSAASYFIVCIGSPLAVDGYTAAAMGILLLAPYICALVYAIKKDSQPPSVTAFPLSLISFTFLTVAVLVLTRSGVGVWQAFQSRYTTLTIPGIVGLYMAILQLRVKYQSLKPFLFGFVLSLMALGIIASYGHALISYDNAYGNAIISVISDGESTRAYRSQTAYYLSTFEVQSDENLALLYPNPQVVRERAEILKKLKLNVFSYPPFEPERLTLVEGSTLFYIDTINGRQLAHDGSHIIIDAQQEQTITISGWAVDQKAGEAAGGVFINVDGQIDIPALYGLNRPDVASSLKNSNYRFSGFSASFATSVLGEGQHTLSLKIVTADKKGYYQPEQTIVLEVR